MGSKFKNRIGKQFKEFSFDTKELHYDGESRTISGYGAVFGNRDKAGDVLLKGCFAKSIAERGVESNANDKILLLWQHNHCEPIGKITVLKEDDHGLYFEAEIDDVERGNQALKQLQSGTLNQFSIGYRYVWDKCEWDSENDTLYVKEVELYEISVVSIGCNGETEFLGMKAEEGCDPYEELSKEIEDVCKGMPATKKEALQSVIRKAMSLSAVKSKEDSLDEKKADQHIEEKKFNLFTNLKLKKHD